MKFFSIWEKTSKKKVRNYMIIAAVIICLLGGGIAGGIAITGDSDADVAKGTDKKIETYADKDKSAAVSEKKAEKDDKANKAGNSDEKTNSTKNAGKANKKTTNTGSSGNSGTTGHKSSGSSSGSSTSSGTSSGSSGGSTVTTPTKPVHTHSYSIPVYGSKSVPAKICSGCGYAIATGTGESISPHIDADPFDSCDGWYSGTTTINTVIGYKCSCGAMQ